MADFFYVLYGYNQEKYPRCCEWPIEYEILPSQSSDDRYCKCVEDLLYNTEKKSTKKYCGVIK